MLMKQHYLLIFLLFLGFCSGAQGQSIRKNYQEMTDSERQALVGAFYELRLGADLINDLAQFHSDFFNFDNSPDPTQPDIHFNLPDEPERQIFFPWHRRQIFELEQAMQEINPNISIPWWDTSVDQDVNSPLWDENFLGQFNLDWGLNRNLGGNGPLPTPVDVSNLQAMTDFLLYSNEMERGPVHRGGHVWIGGAMASGLSPRDPAFYLHHTNVDRLWAEWEDANPGGSFHIITSMIRYDGTYVFDGVTLPLVDPDDIVNTRALGVFYANNQLAVLSDYTVSNTYNTLENFYYQYVIQAGDNFVVPGGTSCKFESVNQINLTSGFSALAGSSFVAKIDSDNDVSTTARGIPIVESTVIRNQIPFTYDEAIYITNVYDPKTFIRETVKIQAYPNPFKESISIDLNGNNYDGRVILYDINGRILVRKSFTSKKSFLLGELQSFPPGIYIMDLELNDGKVFRRKFIKN